MKHGNTLEPLAFGKAGAIFSAVVMLLLGVSGNLGIYGQASRQMMGWHMWFSLSPLGIVLGMIEAAVISFTLCYGFAWLYNKFV